MKTSSILSILVLTACTQAASAQSQHTTIDLSKDPGRQPTLISNSSNASLLQQSQQTDIQKPDSAMLHPKGAMDGTYNGRTLQPSSDNPQMMNSQSTQYNLGNTKATSTIYYDETGKMKGNSTSISIGNKK